MEEVDAMVAAAKKTARYKVGRRAYCKYCYTTHTHWERRTEDDMWFAQGFPFELVWVCLHCDHATEDEFMQIGGREEQGYDRKTGLWTRMSANGEVRQETPDHSYEVIGRYTKDGVFIPKNKEV
jgi:hypothetical protein